MIRRQSSGIFQSTLLSGFDWLEHGFGGRHSQWPPPEQVATLKQIHSNIVFEAAAPGLTGEGDALVTNEPGVLVGVKTADCVPILLVDIRNRAVAAVHAGWRGTAAEIVLRALEAMYRNYQTNPTDVRAAIGPCIGACCYEVGPDVADQFRHWLPNLEPGTRQMLDLITTNRTQLLHAGVAPAFIDAGAPCTYCQPEHLHSFRRDREEAGRMISAIGVI